MSNTVTAYFKGRVGVAEALYQNDYGIVMAFDGIDLPAHFDCYFTAPGSDTAIPGVGADNRVAIPNAVLANSGNVVIHIPLHTGYSDSEVEYIVYFKVIGRARPEDDGTPVQMTAIEQALALLQTPIGNIEQIVNEALSFTGETFDEMQEDLDEWKNGVEGGLTTWKSGVESDFDVLQGQFDTAVAAVTTDTEVTDIRVGADGITDTTAGASVRRQFSDLKSDLNDIDVELYAKDNVANWVDVKGDATKVTGKFIHASYAEPTTSASWNYYELSVSVGDQYLVRTYTNGWARCAVLVDSGGNVLATYPDENVTNKVQTHIITIPSSCTKLYVNESTTTQLLDFSTIEKNESKYSYGVTDLFGSKVLSFVKSAVSVSGYESEDTVSYENIKSNGTKVEGYFFNAYDATPTASELWSYYWFNVKEGTKVKVTGYSAGWARTIMFTDVQYNVLGVYPNPASTGIQSFEVTVPENAVKMFVNENSAQATSEVYRGIIEQVDFTSGGVAHIAHNVTGNKYDIGTDDYVYTVDIKDPYNGLFAFDALKKSGATFKEVSDDVTPLNIQSVRYVGAGHGYFFGYNLTISAHGYTSADIGKTYNDGTNTWVIIKIVNANTIQVVCYDSTAWYRMKTATTPDSVDFGSGTKTVTNSSQVQIYPSVINVDTRILENTDICRIVETYDIMNVGTGIDALLNNVGNNDNDSLANLSDSAITVRNLYEFINNGAVTIYQNLKVLNDNIPLDFYGAVQSGAFGNSDYYGVAETNLMYQDVSATQYFERSNWKDSSKPPILYMQTDGSAGSKAFFTGFIIDNRNADIYNGGSAGFIYGNTRKMYPYFINPHSTEDDGKTYNCVSFRIPCTRHDVSSDVAYACYAKLYDKYIMVIGTDSATNASVEVPSVMQNKKCEVYMADGIEIGTKDIVDRIDVKSSGRGYAIIIA